MRKDSTTELGSFKGETRINVSLQIKPIRVLDFDTFVDFLFGNCQILSVLSNEGKRDFLLSATVLPIDVVPVLKHCTQSD